jgi:hypothetical protein
MMMAFTYDENGGLQIIADSDGTDGSDNKVCLRWTGSLLEVVIGKNVFDVTPHLDPNQPVHALCAVYNHTTGELLGAADGASLQSFGTITFDGATQKAIRFGSAHDGSGSLVGIIGEGILSASQENENTWQWFWDRVKNPAAGQWWDIDTLSGADIFDAWDFGWD